jgi:hypothetical protein
VVLGAQSAAPGALGDSFSSAPQNLQLGMIEDTVPHEEAIVLVGPALLVSQHRFTLLQACPPPPLGKAECPDPDAI